MSEQPKAEERPLKKKLVNKIGMEFILIPGGDFIMGTDSLVDDPADLEAVEAAVREQEKQDNYTRYDSAPQHLVRIRSFYIGRTPVTQGQWELVMKRNQASYKGGHDFPIETVHWYEAQEFIERLNEMMNTNAHRLPSEAEWEYACRAGSPGEYCFEGRRARLDHYAWYGANAGFYPRPVAQKKANKFKLFDMHGLVWEWTNSLEKGYPYRADDGREDLEASGVRVVRGGSWNSDPYFLRCGFRDWHLPVHRDHDIGFRLAVS
ncbi:MAG: formylglycine-generating enzyme family protein [Deltaproteobacteria bacterium]|nr:formylglycine-generating enzyme family protein [Deltaproteobacteria bacterium]MBW2086808.1 formylglycine-generating enzyme family protein [Deltaproteobacteria bacterium]